MSFATFYPIAFWTLGIVGLACFLWALATDERGIDKRLPAFVAAFILAAAAVYADEGVPLPDNCTEEVLRAICGSAWEACWWVMGCYWNS